MGLCNGSKREICAKEGESVSVVERRKRGGKEVYLRTAEEGVYPTIKAKSSEGWRAGDIC